MSLLFNAFTKLHIRLYRATGGTIGGGMFGGKVLLLSTVGNQSGQPRTVPLMYFSAEGRTYIVASAGGAQTHPAWYKNLVAKPEVTVQIGARVFKANAITIGAEERVRIFEQVKRQMKQFAEYEKKATSREIPVVRLDEIGAQTSSS
jgi:deazaflavin-dependent oxidoreductase (nitroreductase family)